MPRYDTGSPRYDMGFGVNGWPRASDTSVKIRTAGSMQGRRSARTGLARLRGELAELERRGIRRLGADLCEGVEAVGGDPIEQRSEVLDTAFESHAGSGCHELVL